MSREWEPCPDKRTFVSMSFSKTLYSKVILFQSCRNLFLIFWLEGGEFFNLFFVLVVF